MRSETTNSRSPAHLDSQLGRARPRSRLAIAVALWLGLAAAGMWTLARHTATPGKAALAPADWPAQSALQPTAGEFSLLMWCHPQCPCTPASLAELTRLVTRSDDRLAVTILFEQPDGMPDQWVRGENWRLALAVPGSWVLVDHGDEARRFGVRTSGQTLIFDRNARLRFNGGLTGGRGHVGENAGVAAALNLLVTGDAPLHVGPVFGCSLGNENEVGAAERAGPGRVGLHAEGKRS